MNSSLRNKNVLCTLVGPMAVENVRTRNGTIYSGQVWDHIEISPDYQEMIENNSFYIGLDHPEAATRSSIVTLLKDVAGIARNMTRTPEGIVKVVVDILDTPMGRIAYTLASYGSSLGISTRMNGEVDKNGNVIPDTIEFLGADLVSVPSQIKGRLKMVLNESKDTRKLKKSAYLTEAIKYVKSKPGKFDKSLLESMESDLGNSSELDQYVELLKSKFKFNGYTMTSDKMLRNLKTGRDIPITLIAKVSPLLYDVYTPNGGLVQFEVSQDGEVSE